jgi:hypothetical protein
VFKVIREAQGLKVFKVTKAYREQLGNVGPLESKAYKAPQGLQERKVPPVQALAMETQRVTSSIGMEPYGRTYP